MCFHVWWWQVEWMVKYIDKTASRLQPRVSCFKPQHRTFCCCGVYVARTMNLPAFKVSSVMLVILSFKWSYHDISLTLTKPVLCLNLSPTEKKLLQIEIHYGLKVVLKVIKNGNFCLCTCIIRWNVWLFQELLWDCVYVGLHSMNIRIHLWLSTHTNSISCIY